MSGALLIAGLGLIALAAWASRRGGARARAARLLAGLSPITPHQALLAGEGRYLAIEGGIDAAEAFDDENHRPLVYRRERVLVADKTTWRELERVVRSVPFFIADGGHAVAIDAAALAGGLVVIERQWEGSVAELAAAAREYRDPATTALVKQLAVSTPTLTARVILEQISTLDRGTAAGLLRNGTLTAGGEGQPLVLTTLDRRDALRILGNERSGNLAASLLTLAALVAGIAITVIAAAGLIGELSAAWSSAAGSSAAGPSATPPGAVGQTPSPESGDVRGGGIATGPGGLLALVGYLLLPLGFGLVVAAVARAIVRRRSTRSTISE